jgi:serine protease Do
MQNDSPVGTTALKRLTLALVTVGAVGAIGAVAVHQNYAGATAPQAAQAAPAAAPLVAATTIALPDFSQMAARNGPAVVNISVTGTTKVGMDGSDDDGDDDAAQASSNQGNDPLQDFFRRFQGPQGGGGTREVPMHGLGSGFIVSPDGVIMTNAHVVKGAKEVTVKLTDRREFRAKVLGSDPATDIAVLKIDAHNLPVVPLGSANDLKVGEWVLAIGSPYGFDNTVTAGVVSAKGRSLPDDSNVPFIQTDVAVNPGNSGGPLFNVRGQVVGINSQIYSQTGGFQGLSFAIPIDLASRIKDEIVKTGKASHAMLGVTVQDVNQGFADSFQLASPEGALVANVEPGTPAAAAGLKSGDVIRKMNGQPIVASGDLPAMVGTALPGDKVALQVWRGGKMIDLTAQLGDAAKKVALAGKGGGAGSTRDTARLGLTLRPLQPDEQRVAGVGAGLLIEDAGGAAGTAGVQAGDVLLMVNGQPVSTSADVRAVVARSAKSVALLIQRGSDKIFIPVRLG